MVTDDLRCCWADGWTGWSERSPSPGMIPWLCRMRWPLVVTVLVPSARGHRAGWAGQRSGRRGRSGEVRTGKEGRARSRQRALARGSPHGPGQAGPLWGGTRRAAPAAAPAHTRALPGTLRTAGAAEPPPRPWPADGTRRAAPGALRGRPWGAAGAGSSHRAAPHRRCPHRDMSRLPRDPQEVSWKAGYQFDLYINCSHQFLPESTLQWCLATTAVN